MEFFRGWEFMVVLVSLWWLLAGSVGAAAWWISAKTTKANVRHS